jgi:hypothetical protein
MRHTLIYPPPGPSDLGFNPNFNVVIAYEDFETGKHAKKICDFLTENLGPDCHVNNQMWKFDVLGLPKLREMAAKDAAAADIIIISCRGESDLPEPLKAWIELWLAEKGGALALVALFDRPQDHLFQSRVVRDYLAGVARRGHMAFFAQPEEDGLGEINEEEHLKFAHGLKREDRASSALAGAVYRDHNFPRWGINE